MTNPSAAAPPITRSRVVRFPRFATRCGHALGLAPLAQRHTDAAEDAAASAALQPSHPHPLDPLSQAEIAQAVDVVRESDRTPKDLRFVTVALQEPTRQAVVEYTPGNTFPREAFLILLDNATGKAIEVIVDLRRKTVGAFKELPHAVQPPIMADEFAECEEAVKRSPEFLAASRSVASAMRSW